MSPAQPPAKGSRASSRTTYAILRRCGRQLVATDLLFKCLAFVVLTPLLGLLVRTILALTGRNALADKDLLFFFLGPVGWGAAIALGGVWLAIVAIEQVALLAILVAATFKTHPRVVPALRLAIGSAPSILGVTFRMVGWGLLMSAPFLAAIGLIYLGLVARHDINFYLTVRPGRFWIALILAGLTGMGLLLVLGRVVSGWFYTLPLIVLERIRSGEALRVSLHRAKGHRRTIFLWIVAWFLATSLLSGAALGLVGYLCKLAIVRASGSLWSLIGVSGLALGGWLMVNLVLNSLASISFAIGLAHLYRTRAKPERIDLERIRALQGEGENQLRLTSKRLAWGLLLALGVSVATGIIALQTVRMDDAVEVIAHRGASSAAPENTLAAIREAMTQGTDWVEIDVQQTSDGEVVLLHDADLKKVAGDSRPIWTVPFADLRDLDVGSHFHPDFRDERLPTLRQVLELCRPTKVRVKIELKYYGRAAELEAQLVPKVAALIRETRMDPQVSVMSLNHPAIDAMRELRPTWPLGLLTAVAAGDLRRSGADFLAVNAHMAQRRFVRSVHRADQHLLVWTVNDPVSMALMIGRGVDGLITDQPRIAREVLAWHEELGLTERFLLQLSDMLGVPPMVGEQ